MENIWTRKIKKIALNILFIEAETKGETVKIPEIKQAYNLRSNFVLKKTDLLMIIDGRNKSRYLTVTNYLFYERKLHERIMEILIIWTGYIHSKWKEKDSDAKVGMNHNFHEIV